MLEEKLNIHEFDLVSNHKILIYDTEIDRALLIKTLVMNDVGIKSAFLKEGSSRIKSFGSHNNALAIAKRCFIPKE